MKKFIFIICLLIYSNTQSRENELGFSLRYGISNFSELWLGAGLHYSHYINEFGSIRISYMADKYDLDHDGPTELGHNIGQTELRAHYFYHIPDIAIYIGLGALYSWHELSTGHSNGDVHQESISNAWGVDLAAGIKVGKAFNIEVDYTFKYPDLVQWRTISWRPATGGEVLKKINLNTFHLNLLFFFSF